MAGAGERESERAWYNERRGLGSTFDGPVRVAEEYKDMICMRGPFRDKIQVVASGNSKIYVSLSLQSPIRVVDDEGVVVGGAVRPMLEERPVGETTRP